MMAAGVAADRVGVALVTDRGLGTSNSAVAQGGLQLPEPGDAALARFRADIRNSGGSGIDEARLDRFVREVRPTIELLTSWGLELDRTPDGSLVRRIAGGLSEPRIVTSGDRIGSALLKVLRSRLIDASVDLSLQSRVIDIELTSGGFGLRLADGAVVEATAVVLAVGGGAFEAAVRTGVPTSNPANQNTGLYEAVRRLGVEEADTDLFQYQPYGIVHPVEGVTGKCVPESVVELGASVVDASGVAVARSGADRRELTAAMFEALADGRGSKNDSGVPTCVLNLGEVADDELFGRYPHLERALVGARTAEGHVHVMPVLHYQLGGFRVAPDGSTTVPGLHLAGEMAGGLHGRNRLMGNGITEAVVSGRLAGLAAADFVARRHYGVTEWADS